MVFCKFQNTASKKWYLHFFTGKLFQNNLNNIATPKTQAQAKIRNSRSGFSIFCLWWETACLTRQYFLSIALEGSNVKSHIRQDICLSTKSLPHSSMQAGCISILNFLPSGRSCGKSLIQLAELHANWVTFYSHCKAHACFEYCFLALVLTVTINSHFWENTLLHNTE